MPWLTMYSAAPAIDWVVKANTPSAMKPKWAIEVNVTNRLRSLCPAATIAP